MTEMNFRARTHSVRESARQHLAKLRQERLAQRARPQVAAEEAADPPEVAVPEVAELPESALPPEPLVAESAPEAAEAPVEPAAELAAEPAAEPAADAPKPKPRAKRKPPAEKPAPQAAKPAATVRPAPRPAPALRPPAGPEDQSIRRAAIAEMSDAPSLRLVAEAAPPSRPPAEPPAVAELVEADPVPQEAPLLPDSTEQAHPIAEASGPADVLPEDPEAAPPDVAAAEGAEPSPAPPGDLQGLPGAGPGLIWMLGQCGIATLSDLAAAEPADLSRRLGLVGQILDVGLWRDYAVQTLATAEAGQRSAG